MQELKEKAKKAINKKSLYGKDIDIEKFFKIKLDEHPKIISEKDKERLLISGIDLNEEKVEAEFMSDYSIASNVKNWVEESTKESYTPIEILNLSPRTLNALINWEVGSAWKA